MIPLDVVFDPIDVLPFSSLIRNGSIYIIIIVIVIIGIIIYRRFNN